MTTSYPGALDSSLNTVPAASAVLGTSTPTHRTHHQNIADAIVALETALGLNPAGGETDAATRMGAVSAIGARQRSMGQALGKTLAGQTILQIPTTSINSPAGTVTLARFTALKTSVSTVGMFSGPNNGNTFTGAAIYSTAGALLGSSASDQTSKIVNMNSTVGRTELAIAATTLTVGTDYYFGILAVGQALSLGAVSVISSYALDALNPTGAASSGAGLVHWFGSGLSAFPSTITMTSATQPFTGIPWIYGY